MDENTDVLPYPIQAFFVCFRFHICFQDTLFEKKHSWRVLANIFFYGYLFCVIFKKIYEFAPLLLQDSLDVGS